MSIFRSLSVTCPNCETVQDVDAVESVNADRRSDLRDDILNGSFQILGCGKCEKKFRLDPAFNYLDVGRGQWLSVQPLDRLPDWIEFEDLANDTFSQAYGDQAPPAAREIGNGLKPRLVFGWAALREKIVAADNKLDDIALESLKLALIQGLGNMPMTAENELRLEGIDGEFLELNWINGQTEEIVEPLRVPREMYDNIVKDSAAWAAVRQQLETGPFVDMQKLYMGAGRPVPA